MIRFAPIVFSLLAANALAQNDVVPVSYARDVRPILDAHCAGCHQPAKPRGGLDVTSIEQMLTGGDSGPALVPGDSTRSPLALTITAHDGKAPLMPQDRDPLHEQAVERIRRWIEQGASDDTPHDLIDRVNADHPPVYSTPPIVTALAYSPDGSILAVCGYHETLLFSPDSGALLSRLIGRAERIESIAFSPDGTRLAVAGGSPSRYGELQIWNVAKRELEHAESVTADSIRGVSWSPSGELVAFGCADRSVRAFDVKKKKLTLFNAAHDDFVLDTAFSKDGSHLVSVSRDRSMKLVKVETAQFIDNITSITPGQTKGGLMTVRRHPVDDLVLTGGADGVPRLYKIYREQKRQIGDDFNLVRAFESLGGRIGGVAFSPDGSRFAAVASSRSGGELRVHTVADGALVLSRSEAAPLYALAFRSDGSAIASAGRDGVVRVRDVASGELQLEFAALPVPAPPTPVIPTPSDDSIGSR